MFSGFLFPTSATQMASPNRDSAASNVAADYKGAEPNGVTARCTVGRRLQEELMSAAFLDSDMEQMA